MLSGLIPLTSDDIVDRLVYSRVHISMFTCMQMVQLCCTCRIVSVQTFVLSVLWNSLLMWSALTMPLEQLLPETSSPPTRSVFLWVSQQYCLYPFPILTASGNWAWQMHFLFEKCVAMPAITQSIIRSTRLSVMLKAWRVTQILLVLK